MKTGALALLALLMLAATPEDCNMPTKYMGDVTIHKLTTPADGDSTFNDRPVFNAGIEIPQFDPTIGDEVFSDSADMLGRIVLASPSISISSPITDDLAYYGSIYLYLSEQGSQKAARLDAFGEIAGANADKLISVAVQIGGYYTEIVSVAIPAAYEGYWAATIIITHRAIVDPNDPWYVSLEVRTANGSLFAFDGTTILPGDSSVQFSLGMESQNVGDTITIHQATVLKIPY